MKRLVLVILACICLSGCGSTTVVAVNVEDAESTHSSTFGRNALIEIGDGLYYDSTTRIVYWWNGIFGLSKSTTSPSPYYAPNGLPYRYNPETNTFEEINVIEEINIIEEIKE